MINIQTLVDSAIEANREAYVEAYRDFCHWTDCDNSTCSEESKIRRKGYADIEFYTFNAIKDSIVRIFPDYAAYIEATLSSYRGEPV
jgi:hypothetical protein